MLRRKISFYVVAPILASSNYFTSEASIDGIISKLTKPVNSYVRAGEIIAFINHKDGSFSFDDVPVRAPISGTIKSVFLNSNNQVQKGQKLFTIAPDSVFSSYSEEVKK